VAATKVGDERHTRCSGRACGGFEVEVTPSVLLADHVHFGDEGAHRSLVGGVRDECCVVPSVGQLHAVMYVARPQRVGVDDASLREGPDTSTEDVVEL
jgi:hypothetical protein